MICNFLKISAVVIISATIFDAVSSRSLLDQLLDENLDEYLNGSPTDRNKVWTSGSVGWSPFFPVKGKVDNDDNKMSSKDSSMNSKGDESGGAQKTNDEVKNSGSSSGSKSDGQSQDSNQSHMNDDKTGGSMGSGSKMDSQSGSDMTEKSPMGDQSSGGDMTEKSSMGDQSSGNDSSKKSPSEGQSSDKMQGGGEKPASSAVISSSNSASNTRSNQPGSDWIRIDSSSQQSNSGLYSSQTSMTSTSKIAAVELSPIRSSFKQKIDRFFQKWNFLKTYQEGQSSSSSNINEIIFE